MRGLKCASATGTSNHAAKAAANVSGGANMNSPGTSGEVRTAAVAGAFYPARKEYLQRAVSEFLASSQGKDLPSPPKALIVPHAGYPYSGPIAGSGFASLLEKKDVKRAVLLGPSHHFEFAGLALSEAAAFETPLGVVPVDMESGEKLRALPQVQRFSPPHKNEHCLEVELPFLQHLFHDFAIVPLLVGDAKDEEIAEALELLWGGPETIFIISSDLSHYFDYETASRLDAQTAAAINHLQPEAIDTEQACGRLPICGLLRAASRRGLHAHTLDLRNSGDTAGRRDWVVGYGAFAFTE